MSDWKNNSNGTSTFTTTTGYKITVGNEHLANGNWHGMSVGDFSKTTPGYHEYSTVTNLGYSTGQVNISVATRAFNDNLTPFGSYFAGPGFVSHYAVTEKNAVNVTTNLHMLDPGVVQRDLFIKDGFYHVKTFGVGAGYFGAANVWLASAVWTQADVNIMMEIRDLTGIAPNLLKAGAVDTFENPYTKVGSFKGIHVSYADIKEAGSVWEAKMAQVAGEVAVAEYQAAHPVDARPFVYNPQMRVAAAADVAVDGPEKALSFNRPAKTSQINRVDTRTAVQAAIDAAPYRQKADAAPPSGRMTIAATARC